MLIVCFPNLCYAEELSLGLDIDYREMDGFNYNNLETN